MIDCRPQSQQEYYDEDEGELFIKERGIGVPRTDVERVMSHYGIDRATAEYWLTVHPVDVLLPARGTGIERGTAAALPPAFEKAFAVPAVLNLRAATVFQGVITGSITSLTVPQVEAGAYIDITLSYDAYNPNGSFWNPWKIAVVAKDSLGNKELVKDADVRSDRFSDSGTWRLWKMPSQSIQLEIRLYGHDEIVPWDWSYWP